MPTKADGSYNKSLANKFYNLIDPLASNNISISYGKSILNLGYIDSLRLLYEHQPENEKDKIFKHLVLKTFSDAEKKCSGSGIISVVSFLKCVSREFDLKEVKNTLQRFSQNSKRGNLEDLNEIIDFFSPDDAEKNVCLKIIEEGGFSASCDILTTYELQDSFEIVESSRFNVRLNRNFSSATKIKEASGSYSDIIVADGIIEEVSEIHHILEYYSKNKKQCFIICRGFSDDVINTLSTNYLRGSLRVIPGTLIYNLDSINSLKDICVISMSDMISTLKGDRFSNLEMHTVKTVEHIKLDLQSLEIKNEIAYPSVISLVKNIRKQIEQETVEDKREILEKRAAQLSPRKVNIKLSNHKKDRVGLSKDRIKLLVSMMNSTCQSGIIELDKNLFSNPIISDVVSFLNQKDITKMPARCFFEGFLVGITNAKMLNSTRQMILIDSDS